MKKLTTTTALSGALLLAFAGPLAAQTQLPTIDVRAPKPFSLGQIKVGEARLAAPTRIVPPPQPIQGPPAPLRNDADVAPTPKQNVDTFGGYTVTNRQTWTFARDTLDQAVNLAPGVTSQLTGNSRNETNIYVRGFDRWQVPLTIDGVRVYLPVDNRLDFARFATPDIAEIQIAKGYVSVLDGPGGMGGQINLVTRKPSRPLETDFRTRFEFGRDGTFLGPRAYALAGTKQDQYYAQLSGLFQDFKGFMLPESYKSTLLQGWGLRGQSYAQDYSINAKVGITPNATDEYSLSFIRQDGQKGAPLHTTDPLVAQRFWRWPYWRVQNLYFLSKTKLGDSSYVKTRGYWTKFDNSLVSYDNPSFFIQTLPRSFNSQYSDYALGAEVEAGTQFGDMDTLKALFFYRLDHHAEWQENFGTNLFGSRARCFVQVPCSTQPVIASIEDTYSLAVENTFHPRPDVDLVGGFSYDWRHLRQAQGYTIPQGVINYRTNGIEAPNYQGAAIWRYDD